MDYFGSELGSEPRDTVRPETEPHDALMRSEFPSVVLVRHDSDPIRFKVPVDDLIHIKPEPLLGDLRLNLANHHVWLRGERVNKSLGQRIEGWASGDG